jgi:glycosyltransferase involved in cell wall biosynthesis
MVLSLARVMASWRPDVVHSWNWTSTLLAAPTCRLLRIPLLDGTIQTGALQPELFWLKRIGMACSCRIVANSHAGLQAWHVGPAKGRVVYSGFDPARLPERTPPASPADAPFTVIMTARMVPVKDYAVVIEAARLLSAETDGWRFLLVGDGADRRKLQEEAKDLVDTGVVVFPESGIEVLDLVCRADVGVLMTNPALAREGCSNSILEYMALGLPVVCGDGGGNPEVVLDGTTGYVVPQGDAAALAERLDRLRADASECAAMGSAGKARLQEAFSLDSMVRGMIRVYLEALADTRPEIRCSRRAR